MLNYSEGTNLLWKIASIEAQNLKHQEIDPVDLMLGLLKIVDIEPEKIIRNPNSDALESINKEVAEIKEIFQESLLVPSKTRRRLRRECFCQIHNIDYKDGIIHRSELSKRIFTKAERYLFPREKNIRPFHILKALLEEENPDLDRALLLVSWECKNISVNWKSATSFKEPPLG
jgi:ATP-dependent Clp protease ATP-binding subunit ClpC